MDKRTGRTTQHRTSSRGKARTGPRSGGKARPMCDGARRPGAGPTPRNRPVPVPGSPLAERFPPSCLGSGLEGILPGPGPPRPKAAPCPRPSLPPFPGAHLEERCCLGPRPHRPKAAGPTFLTLEERFPALVLGPCPHPRQRAIGFGFFRDASSSFPPLFRLHSVSDVLQDLVLRPSRIGQEVPPLQLPVLGVRSADLVVERR